MARRQRVENDGSRGVSNRGTLADPFPSNPTRPTKYAVYVTYPFDAPAGQKRLITQGFTAIYATKKFIDAVVQGEKYTWRDHETIVTDSGVGIRMPQYKDALADIIEHDYTPQEEAWDLPDAMAHQAMGIRQEYREERLGEDGERAPKPKREPKPEKVKVDKTGLVTVGEIAEQMGVEARDARAALRKQKVEKPDAGWAWPADQVEAIKTTIKAGLK